MSTTVFPEGSTAARARDWRNAMHAAVCDSLEPWEFGTVARASRFPTYYDFNVMRVERETGLDVAALSAHADVALEGLGHRRVDFDLLEQGEARRHAFEAAGWKTTRLVWMLHEQPLPAGESGIEVEEVLYDATDELRLRWHMEDFGELEYEGYKIGAREIAMLKGARVLAVREAGKLVAFTQLQWEGPSAEVNSVYVAPDHRGRGLGTAITRAAILAAADAADLWIVADDEDRAKDLYARLGFRAAWRTEEFLRLS